MYTIGVFDSGVGGLSVLRHIRHVLPDAQLIYVADSGHVPYGDKTPSYIEQRSIALAHFMVEHHVDAIVIACNTATAAAAASLRSRFNIPIIAMEPAVKPAVAATRSGVVGVLATIGTLKSARFAALLERYAGNIKIITQGCPGLVEQVELGDLNGVETRQLITRYAAPLLARGADTLILGCTHYPFLAPIIAEVVGLDIVLVDTGAAVARQLQHRLTTELTTCKMNGFLGDPSTNHLTQSFIIESESIQFWTSGDAERASHIMSVLWGNTIEAKCLPQAFM